MGRTIVNVAGDATSVTVPVPEDVAEELSTLAEHAIAHPSEKFFASFDTETERNDYEAQARSWAKVNRYRFRKMRGKVKPTELQFRLSLPESDETSE